MVLRTLLLFFFALMLTPLARASDLGAWGHVYPIVEEDFLTFIHKRLEHMKNSGELQKIKARTLRRVKAHVLRPEPVRGLTTTEAPRTFYYDPTYVLGRDLRDAKGKVLWPKGTRVNPLNTVRLHKVLFFVNADDPRQIAWAQKAVKQFDFVKILLVGGNIKKATQALKMRVYFDQEGILSKKLGLQHVPCWVQQVGKRLEIREFSLDA